MKQFILSISIIANLACLAGCDSVTGQIINDYNQGKHPVVELKNVPDPVMTLDQLEKQGNRVDVVVNDRYIKAYRYRLNDGAWSQEYEVIVPVTLSNMECGRYRLEFIGTKNGHNWQSYKKPTVCEW